LSQYIAPENIPKKFGGTLDFNFGDLATVDPAYADSITWKDDGSSGPNTASGEIRRWPRGPVRWVEREDGNLDLLAVGSLNGKQRREVVATMKIGEKGGWADHSVPHPRHMSHNEAEAIPTVVEESQSPLSESPDATTTQAIEAVPLDAIAKPLPGDESGSTAPPSNGQA
jgi:hypothetical protein